MSASWPSWCGLRWRRVGGTDWAVTRAAVEEIVAESNPYEAPMYRRPALQLLDALYLHTKIRTLRAEGRVVLWPDGAPEREGQHPCGDELYFNEPPQANELSPWLARYY